MLTYQEGPNYHFVMHLLETVKNLLEMYALRMSYTFPKDKWVKWPSSHLQPVMDKVLEERQTSPRV